MFTHKIIITDKISFGYTGDYRDDESRRAGLDFGKTSAIVVDGQVFEDHRFMDPGFYMEVAEEAQRKLARGPQSEASATRETIKLIEKAHMNVGCYDDEDPIVDALKAALKSIK